MEKIKSKCYRVPIFSRIGFFNGFSFEKTRKVGKLEIPNTQKSFSFCFYYLFHRCILLYFICFASEFRWFFFSSQIFHYSLELSSTFVCVFVRTKTSPLTHLRVSASESTRKQFIAYSTQAIYYNVALKSILVFRNASLLFLSTSRTSQNETN